MKVPITNRLKGKIFAALLAAGVSAPSAYVATQLTVPSEGVVTHLHLDPVGLKTTCIGHLVKKVKHRNRITLRMSALLSSYLIGRKPRSTWIGM